VIVELNQTHGMNSCPYVPMLSDPVWGEVFSWFDLPVQTFRLVAKRLFKITRE
jgi:hypothetical protein